VTGFTGGGQIEGQVARVGAGGIVIGVATGTVIGCIIVITVVTGSTVAGNWSVCSREWIEVVMDGESSGHPSGVCCMTHFAVSREIQNYVTRVYRLGIIIVVATVTSVGYTIVITLMAIVTGDGCVRACERPYSIMIESRGYPCILIVAVGTV
jgi:hypothetical protein